MAPSSPSIPSCRPSRPDRNPWQGWGGPLGLFFQTQGRKLPSPLAALKAQVTQPRSEEQLGSTVTASGQEMGRAAGEVLALHPCSVSRGFCGGALSGRTPRWVFLRCCGQFSKAGFVFVSFSFPASQSPFLHFCWVQIISPVKHLAQKFCLRLCFLGELKQRYWLCDPEQFT